MKAGVMSSIEKRLCCSSSGERDLFKVRVLYFPAWFLANFEEKKVTDEM